MISKRQRNREAAGNAAVVANAYANHDQRCVECGNTLDECGPGNDGRNANGTPCTWDAGHSDGRWIGPERRAECSYCNRSRAAHQTNANRNGYDHGL